jgi:thiol-disulfide isomerase/thioredoxin
MRKCILALVLTVLLNNTGRCQLPGLKVGDKIPNLYLGKFLDDPFSKLKISDIKAKLIILDFWNTHCTVCLTGMPKMDSIQKKFKGQVKIFAITYNTAKQVNQLFEKIKINKPGFPIIVQDSVFNSLFPHNGDPLHVWIDKNGVVIAITFHFNTNFETIDQYLNGVDPHLSRRWDFGFNPDYNLVSEPNSALLALSTNYSVLFRGLNEYTIETYIRVENERIQLTNATLLTLYGLAYNNEVYGFSVDPFNIRRNNRIILEVKNQVPFIPPSEESKLSDWIKNYVVSYELKFPDGNQNVKYRYMQEDLHRYFPFNAEIEKRKVKCLVLVNTSDQKFLKVKDSTSFPLMEYKPDKSFAIQNMPVSALVAELIYSNPSLNVPIVDETNFKFNIDINIKSSLSNIESLKSELRQHGLDLVEKEKEIDMLIISDAK